MLAYLVGVENNVVSVVDPDVKVGHGLDGRTDDFEVATAVVGRPPGEEGAVEVAEVVVHCPPSAVTPSQLKRHVRFEYQHFNE